jgi:hypothetical protein
MVQRGSYQSRRNSFEERLIKEWEKQLSGKTQYHMAMASMIG